MVLVSVSQFGEFFFFIQTISFFQFFFSFLVCEETSRFPFKSTDADVVFLNCSNLIVICLFITILNVYAYLLNTLNVSSFLFDFRFLKTKTVSFYSFILFKKSTIFILMSRSDLENYYLSF